MAKKKTPYTGAQLKLAQNFLKAIHANSNNGYLIIAVLAFIKAERGGLTAANFRRVAARILAGRTGRYRGIYAAAHGDRGKGKDKLTGIDKAAQQALDFLQEIAESSWRTDHYGAQTLTPIVNPIVGVIVGYELSPYDAKKNTLVATWQRMLGFPIVIPADPVKPAPAPKAPPVVAARPTVPRESAHPIIHVGYLEPYAAYNFLKSRLEPQEAPPGDPRATGL